MFKSDHGFKRIFARLNHLSTLGDLGITPRLALAFSAVAALAAAANLIVDNGALIVERRLSPAISTNYFDTSSSNSIHPASNELKTTLDAFDQAVRAHADENSKASAGRYQKARLDLDQLASQYPVADKVGRHERTASIVIESASERRLQADRYATIFASMDARLRASIGGAWKILGRVIARQSLLELSSQLEDIRASFAAADVGRLEAAERAFATTLQENQNALRRSQGNDWQQNMQSDLAELVATRASLAQAEKRKTSALQSFSAEASALAARLPDRMLSAIPSHAVENESAIFPGVPRFEPSFIQYPADESTPPPRRAIVAWVSAFVLVLLLYLCFATIVSIVRPVRRLLEASRKLANGETVHALPSGGIRELDLLTAAFNAMAEQLDAAQIANRQSHQQLESQVDERTRQLQELAERDPLTGLANRRQLFIALNAAIEEARLGNVRIGVFFLDLDNFKTLNDSMGHAYGDRVLLAIAQRIEIAARPFGFAARLGGDEFTIVHEGASSAAEILDWGAKIVAAFQMPIKVDGRELIVSVSAGASIYPDHEQEAEALVRAADAALFSAKALGRSRLAIFTPELLVRATAKFATEQNLRRAIQNGEFELFYQPEVRIDSLEPQLVEALLRWRMPDGTYRLPGDFLAVAEESGLIIEINDWVLRTAIEAASEWHRGAWPETRVAINVSSRQFLDYRFVEQLQQLLEEFQLPAGCIELELTESVLQTGPSTIKTLAQLRGIGVAIALDDFGTGYSSLASLEQLPFTRIKLDRSLIASIDSSGRSASIARAIIGLCGDLGLEVTAEGVERIEQFALLLGHRKMSLQGFLIARPVRHDELLPLLQLVAERSKQLLLHSIVLLETSHKSGTDVEPLVQQAGRFRFGR